MSYKTLKLKVNKLQYEELKERARQIGVDAPADVMKKAVQNELKGTAQAREARREAIADELDEMGWNRQAEKVREGELSVDDVSLSYGD